MNRRTLLLGAASALVASSTVHAAKPKLVITGDMGMVAGRIFSLGFLQERYEIVGVDRKRGVLENINGTIYVDPKPGTSWYDKINGAVAVLHLAWEMTGDNGKLQINSLEATRNVMFACGVAKVPVLAFSSSAWAAPGLYGHKTFRDDRPWQPYGFAKRLAEQNLKEWSTATDSTTKVGVWRLGRVTPKAIADPVFGPEIMMTDDDVRDNILAILNPVEPYVLRGPFAAR